MTWPPPTPDAGASRSSAGRAGGTRRLAPPAPPAARSGSRASARSSTMISSALRFFLEQVVDCPGRGRSCAPRSAARDACQECRRPHQDDEPRQDFGRAGTHSAIVLHDGQPRPGSGRRLWSTATDGLRGRRLLTLTHPRTAQARKRGEKVSGSTFRVQRSSVPGSGSGVQIRFNFPTICSRCGSRNGGSAIDSPSVRRSSSTVKPGPSVATSNNRPFGSRT